MRIATKINAALLGTFALGTLAAFAVLTTTIQPRFDEIEREQAKMNHERVTDAFHTFADKLKTAAQDYAYWDETYQFLLGNNSAEFVASNLSPEFKAVENLGIHALVFMRADGTVEWGAAYDLETEEPIEGLVAELAELGHTAQFAENSDTLSLSGLVNSSKGLLLVAVSPALKSDRSGPAVGKVISAKLLNVQAAKDVTSVDFVLEPLLAGRATPVSGQSFAIESDEARVQTTSIVPDAFGKPLVILKASSPRDISRAGSIAVHTAMSLMVLAGLLSAGVLWFFFRREFVARIEALRTHFATAGSSGKVQQTATDAKNDEIGDLTQSFNAMANQVNHLRDALSESAYKSGLSDWAAGTLHNVRNGIAPIPASAWQIDKLFDTAWLKNVETAAAEYADDATPPGRRQLLNTYLVSSALNMAGAAKQSKDFTATINDASKAIVDMVSQFEKYAHRKVDTEAVDLQALIADAWAGAPLSNKLDADFILPAIPATVNGNSIILRQVFSNILDNALESIHAQNRDNARGRIEVAFAPCAGRPGFMRISISDNGEGLSSGQLQEIFKPRVSSRNGQTRGLGLHWCANAIQLLQGAIHAESDGVGLGATLVIELPVFAEQKKEAA